MIDNGYVKLYRSLLNWECYKDVNTKHLYLHLLLTASHKDTIIRGQQILRGQLITSRSKLVTETGLSDKQVRLCLDKLQRANKTASQTSNRHTIITLLDYPAITKQKTCQVKSAKSLNDKIGASKRANSIYNDDKNLFKKKKEINKEKKDFKILTTNLTEVKNYDRSNNKNSNSHASWTAGIQLAILHHNTQSKN